MTATARKMMSLALAALLALAMVPISAPAAGQQAWAAEATTSVNIIKSKVYGPYTAKADQQFEFNFTLYSPSCFVVAFGQNATTSQGDSFKAELNDQWGKTVASWNIQSATKQAVFGDFVLDEGKYTIRLTALTSVSNLQIKANWATLLTAVGSELGSPRDVEIEPNGSTGNATTLPENSALVGSFYDPANETILSLPTLGEVIQTGTDNDYFTFTLDKVKSVSLSFVAQGNTNLTLLDSKGHEIASKNLSAGRTDLSLGDLSSGKYYLAITNTDISGPWGKDYVLKLNTKIIPTLTASQKSITRYLSDYGSFNNQITYDGDGRLSYSSSNTNVVSILSNGNMYAHKAGTATITVTATEGTNYASASTSFTVTVKDGSSSSSSATTAQKKTPVLKAKQSTINKSIGDSGFFNNPISYSGDGKLTYKSSDTNIVNIYYDGDMLAKKAGTVTITVTAPETDNYKAASISFKVHVYKPSSGFKMSKKKIKVAWSDGFSNYYKNASGGKITHKSSNKKVATIDKEGYVTYRGIGETIITNTQAETEYYAKSSASYTFIIVPDRPAIKKLTAGKKSIKVKWKKQSKKFSSGYEIRYSTSKKMKNAKKKVIKGASKASAKIKGLKAGKKYYVQVRVFKKTDGKTYYSAWSKKQVVKTKK